MFLKTRKILHVLTLMFVMLVVAVGAFKFYSRPSQSMQTEKVALTSTEVTGSFWGNWSDKVDNYADVTEIIFVKEAPDGYSDSGKAMGNTRVYRNDIDDTKIAFVCSGIIVPTSCQNLFQKMSQLTTIIFGNFSTDNVTNMTNMFYNCPKLTFVDMSGLSTPAVTNMSYMFYGCEELAGTFGKDGTAVKIGDNFDTSKVTDMSYMFYNCSKLTFLELSKFSTPETTKMCSMFRDCSGLIGTFGKNGTAIKISDSFNTSKVTDLGNMFDNCIKLTSIDLSGFDMVKVTNMSQMFNNCQGLAGTVGKNGTAIKISNNLSLPNVTNLSRIFYGCKQITSVDLSGMSVPKILALDYMIYMCTALTSVNLFFDILEETTIIGIFSGCSQLNKVTASESIAQKMADSTINTQLYVSSHPIWYGEDGTEYDKDNRFNTAGTYTTTKPQVMVCEVTTGITSTRYDSIEDAWSVANSTGTAIVKLLTDVEISSHLIIQSGNNIMLDLNGHILKLKDAGSDQVIEVDGTFTLTDSNKTATHTLVSPVTNQDTEISGGLITSVNDAYGVYVNGGKFIMNDGTIFGNSTGVYVDGGTFTMNDGKISDNNTSRSGGGVSVVNGGTFTMNGGIISGNKAAAGGGVYVSRMSSLSTFSMTSGIISDNIATGYYGGGVYLYGGAFEVSGNPKIKNNKLNEVENNVDETASVIAVTGMLTEGAEIYVNNTGMIATGYTFNGNDKPSKYFISDDEANECIYADSEGTVYISDTHDYSSNGVCSNCGKAMAAKVGNDQFYATFYEAWQAATEAGTATITMLTDAEIDQTLVVEQDIDIILELNGCMLKFTGTSGSVIVVCGRLVVQDSGEKTTSHEINNPVTNENVIVNGGLITGGKGTNTDSAILGGAIYIIAGGEVTLNGGTLAGNIAGSSVNNVSSGHGGAIRNEGSLTVKDGAVIAYNKTECGGGICVCNGNMIMNGGEILNNLATSDAGGVFYENNAVNYPDNKFTFLSGHISFNTANGYCGGVEVGSGVVEMKGNATISYNTTVGEGGGVYVCSDGMFEMMGGSISYNDSHMHGGGVYIDGGIFEMKETAVISNNTTLYRGGGVCVNGTFNMEAGNILENSATGVGSSGGGVRVDGTFNMSGGSITNNTVSENLGGGVFVSTEGKFNVWGNASVTNNNSNGTNSNVCLKNGTKIEVSGAVDNLYICISNEGEVVTGFTNANNPQNKLPAECFCADDSSHKRIYVSDSENGIVTIGKSLIYWGFSDSDKKLIISDDENDIENRQYTGSFEYDVTLDNLSNSGVATWREYAFTSVEIKGNVAPKSTASWFKKCESVKNIDLSGLDASEVTDMSNMFYGCTSLETIEFSNSSATPKFNTSKVTDMAYMFYNCVGLASLDLSVFDTSNTTNMMLMFSGCSHLEAITFSDTFDTSNVTNMQRMFQMCSSLKTIDLSGFNTSNVEDMFCMFYGCTNLNSLDLSSFDMTNVTDTYNMLSFCMMLQTIKTPETMGNATIKLPNTFTDADGGNEVYTSVTSTEAGKTLKLHTEHTYVDGVCTVCGKKIQIYWGITGNKLTISGSLNDVMNTERSDSFDWDEEFFVDLMLTNTPPWYNEFDITEVEIKDGVAPKYTMYWFSQLNKVETVDLSGLNASNIISMRYMFEDCTALKSVTFPNVFDTSSITDMYAMFNNCESLTSIMFPASLDTSKVTNMDCMFMYCDSLISIDMSAFDFSSVTTMSSMFYNCNALETIIFPTSFNASKLNSMISMFANCSALKNITFPTSCNTAQLKDISRMFEGCENLVSVDMSAFDFSSITSCNNVFVNCSKLTTIKTPKTMGSVPVALPVTFWNGTSDISEITSANAGKTLIRHEEHSYGDWQRETAPTCTITGMKAHKDCLVCGKHFDSSNNEISNTDLVISALGHDLVHHEAKAATCTEKGWNAYDTCSRCDHTTYEEISALGHDLVHHEAKQATCTENGWNAYDTCSRCDHTTYEEISTLGHDLVYHEAKQTTCTENGWNAYETCSRCDYSTYEEISSLGHDYGEWMVVRESTIDEFGEERRVCAHDGTHFESRELPKRVPQLVKPDESDGQIDEIIVTIPNGFDPNVELIVTKISQDNYAKYEMIAAATNGQIGLVYDVVLKSDGVTIQPDGMLTIKLRIPENLKEKTFKLFHLHEETATDMEYTVEGDYAVLTTDKLSEFIFIGENNAPASITTGFNPLWMILIIILAVVITGEVGYIVYRKVFQKKISEVRK